MGATYSIEGKIEANKEKIIQKTNEFMNNDENVRWSFDRADRNTYNGILEILFCGVDVDDDKFYADFSTSYGWYGVMIDWFYYIESALSEGDFLRIYYWDEEGNDWEFRFTNGHIEEFTI